MVSIEVASQAGACYGVERALKMVKDAAEKGAAPSETAKAGAAEKGGRWRGRRSDGGTARSGGRA